MREKIEHILQQFPNAAADDLIPMVLAVQKSIGYIPETAISIMAERTGIAAARLYGMVSFYDGLRLSADQVVAPDPMAGIRERENIDPMREVASTEVLQDILLGRMDMAGLYRILRLLRHETISHPVISISHTTCSCGAGSEEIRHAALAWCEERDIHATIRDIGCPGWCSRQPFMSVQLPGKARLIFAGIKADEVYEILDAAHSGSVLSHHLAGQQSIPQAEDWENIRHVGRLTLMKAQHRTLSGLSGVIDPGSISEYIAQGGYSAFVKAVKLHTSRHICDLVAESGLRGRGGGGFPAATKWRTALESAADQRYLICNAQESDPGSRIATALLESNPHQVIEGLAIAAYAAAANKAYVVLRHDAPLAEARVRAAISQAMETGLLGYNIFDSGYNLSIKVFVIPGAFICGEETALISALEGRRGTPWHKPPYPAIRGFLQYPTVVNNAETLANLPHIIEHGPRWYRKTGTKESPGTKMVELAGNVNYPGLYEVAMGMPIREIIRQFGGGSPDNNSSKAVLIGGPLGHLLREDELDLPLDFEDLAAAGSALGSGRIMVLSGSTCMVDIARQILAFIHAESCGKCIPCREGSGILKKILDDLVHRPESERGYETLERFKGVMQMEDLARVMRETSLCGLGRNAANVLLDSLKRFRAEYDEHLFERYCRSGVCGSLRSYDIIPELCTGCNLCSRRCPEGAINGSPRTVHYINKEKCKGCGICAQVCKFSAIRMN